MKKLLTCLLALVLLCGIAVFPLEARAEEAALSGECGQNATWTFDPASGTLTIAGTGAISSYTENFIPWKSHRSGIQTVVIGSGITEIGDFAFTLCENLTKVIIPESITSIGQHAFRGCKNLETIVLPESVKSIGTYAFANCEALTAVNIPTQVTVIEMATFEGCKSLAAIALPENLTAIKNGAFRDCESLEQVQLPEGLTQIVGYTFAGCKSLTSVTIPEGITMIGDGAFFGCESLRAVTIPETVITILERAFSGCASLTQVVIPSSVTAIGEEAFAGCTGLRLVVFQDETEAPKLGDNLFRDVTGKVQYVASNLGWNDANKLPYGGLMVWEGIGPEHQHTWSDPTVENKVEATCTAGGGYDTVVYCLQCDFEQSRTHTDVPAHGHIPAEAVQENLIPAGCETGGRYDEVIYCSVCQEELSRSNKRLPAHGHEAAEPQQENLKPATCTEDGSYDSVTNCKWCGINLKWENILLPALGHSPNPVRQENAVAATCTTEGSYEAVTDCQTCGAVLSRVPTQVPALGHTEVIDAAVAATCTEDGMSEGKHCSVCQEILVARQVVKAHGHSEVIDAAVAPTCTETGLTEGKHCSTCETELAAQEIVAALGHKPAPAMIENELEPDCRNDGQYDTVVYCKECLAEISRETTYRPIASHNYVNGKCTGCGRDDPEWEDSDGILDVKRTQGQDRFFTAFNIANQMKENLGITKFDTIIIASGTSFADALSGSYLATVKNAPILLSYDDAYNTLVSVYIKNNLKASGKVYILGGEKAVPASMEKKLEGYDVQRLAGDDRFGTNLAILKEAGLGDKDLMVCTGLNYADSLSASALGRPILLVWNQLNKEQEQFLQQNLNGNKIYVVGGTEAVPFSIQLDLASYGRIERINGKNRFETSVLIAQEFFDEPNRVVLAYANGYPDGLCGGALAASRNAPLILTMNQYSSYAQEYVQDMGITKGTVLGGTKLISDSTVRKIFDMPEDMGIPST